MAKAGDYDFYCEEALVNKDQLEVEYESPTVIAFHHTRPIATTHIVVIPKEHIHDLRYMDTPEREGVLLEIMKVARDILKKIDVDTEGGRIVTNLGAFQDTPHLHVHIIAGEALR
ncbi:HIT domain-containing protein [candidate division WWE3 bacterium]|uniref:HIT domain-containing protein n=1 Tax=candidate division WWE3 bacterium TaxID=2053526 RepID=A0A955LHF7_UNCKA|nr:HIT domain-containing protein [candidate division WWE3 bacterium]